MSRSMLPEPPDELKRISRELCDRIRTEIEESGFMPFARYMERALYEPGLGYYSAGLHKFGPTGDFVTAPELGSLFARCLAVQVAELGGSLDGYEVLELGAGTGRLAADLLAALDGPGAPRRYRILERSADLRAEQKRVIAERVSGALSRVDWLDRLPEDDWQGVLVANEVIDALAVERFRLEDEKVLQVGAAVADGGFDWARRPAPPELEQAVRALGLDVPRPYTSEILPELPAWLAAVTGRLERGAALFVDYGYPRAEYYLPERRDGTLMCHYRHRAHADPFFWPGLQDLTAFVDFTALAEAGDACGLELAGYTSQVMFLLGCGLDRILAERTADVDDATALRLAAEARQLTLPGMMGERFQAMALTRGIDLGAPLSGFALADLSYRL